MSLANKKNTQLISTGYGIRAIKTPRIKVHIISVTQYFVSVAGFSMFYNDVTNVSS